MPKKLKTKPKGSGDLVWVGRKLMLGKIMVVKVRNQRGFMGDNVHWSFDMFDHDHVRIGFHSEAEVKQYVDELFGN